MKNLSYIGQLQNVYESFQPPRVSNHNINKTYTDFLKMPMFPKGKNVLNMFLLHTNDHCAN